jgi:hypothetical protein
MEILTNGTTNIRRRGGRRGLAGIEQDAQGWTVEESTTGETSRTARMASILDSIPTNIDRGIVDERGTGTMSETLVCRDEASISQLLIAEYNY